MGEYTIRCYGSIFRNDGSVLDTTFTDFKLYVRFVTASVSPNNVANAPRWDIDLQDKTIEVGQNLLYPVDILESLSGLPSKVKVDLGAAKDFLKWDNAVKAFVVD